MAEVSTLKTAMEYAKLDRIEEWIHYFLYDEGNNISFSEGLKLQKRYYIGPVKMPLNMFSRSCGPEKYLKYIINQSIFERNVLEIRQRYSEGWDMPPLIINYSQENFELTDGNHRYEALIREEVEEYYVILWMTTKQDYDQFIKIYHSYMD